MIERNTPTERETRLGFVATCIEKFATSLGVPTQEAYTRMKHSGILKDYLYDCYEALHCDSWDNVMQDIHTYVARWEESQ